ncbi:MAG: S41 family peptidase [Gemmatimonadota bacterium]|nr:MAG: S41 family peptidase [Gemmatimonadota bacterium]
MSVPKALRAAGATAALALCAATAVAQVGAPPQVPTDAAKRAEIVDSVCAALNKTYVFPDVARQMDEFVRAQLADGAYDELPTVADLAQALTRDLRSISHDRHLGVVYAPPDIVARMSAERDEDEIEREEREAAARANYLFKRVEILQGNVGYLRFDQFAPAEWAGPTAVAAMNFLANADAIIFDMRYNGGGSPSLIQLITTYLLEEPTHLNSFYIRETDSTRQFWTLTHVPGPRMPDVPVYVLTSRNTFSGAEEFTYNLKNLERGTIVGDTTGGGAHPTATVLFEHLNAAARVPYGRAVNPISGTNWEGVGVIPDVPVPSERALETAHVMALTELREAETDARRQFGLDWSIAGLEAQLNPATVDPAVLASYAGTYGPRTLTFQDGQLVYQRAPNPPMAAVPMSATLFRFEEIDYFRLEVVLDASGQPSKLVGHYDDGRTDESPRSGG